MAPDQRGEVGDVVVADIHAVRPDLANGLLHVDGVPMHDGIESEAKGAKRHRQVAVGGVADGAMAEATASVACDYTAIAPPVISAQVVKA